MHFYLFRNRKNRDEILEENTENLNEICDCFIMKIIKYFDNIKIKIKEIFEKNQDNALEDIQKLVEDMNAIRTIPELESKTAELYYRIIESIRDYLKKRQLDTEQLLITNNQQSEMIDQKQLTQTWSCLKNATWINNVSPGTHDTLVNDLNGKLIESVRQLEDQLKRLDLSLKIS